MNQSAWLTMTTQCEKLQVLTLRIPPSRCAIDEPRSWTYCRRHERQGHYHKQDARSFRTGKPRRHGRITFAEGPRRPPAGRRDAFQGLYCVVGVPGEEPGRTPPHD